MYWNYMKHILSICFLTYWLHYIHYNNSQMPRINHFLHTGQWVEKWLCFWRLIFFWMCIALSKFVLLQCNTLGWVIFDKSIFLAHDWRFGSPWWSTNISGEGLLAVSSHSRQHRGKNTRELIYFWEPFLQWNNPFMMAEPSWEKHTPLVPISWHYYNGG